MKPFNLKLGILVASFTLAAAPVFAQKPESGGSPAAGAVDRSSGGGAPSSGGAVDRGSSGGSTVASSGSSGSSSSGSTYSSPSAGASSSPSISYGDRGMRQNAPEHRAGFSNARAYAADESGQKAAPRSSGPSGGGASGGTAATRGGGSASGSGGTRAGSGDSGVSRAPARTRTAPSAEAANAPSNNASGTREVPNWARPRGDHPVTGDAKDRTVPPPDRNGNYRDRYGYGYGGGYYDPNGFYNYGSSPFYGDYYYPYGFGMGYGLYSGFGWAPYVGDPYGDPYGGMGGGGYATSYGRGEQGNLKLKVKPRAAKVYVDGYFVGTVDQFDGSFQKLALNTGRHKVEVKADGFQTAEFDVLINPEQTVTFQGDLKRIQ
jgi:PEGA domain